MTCPDSEGVVRNTRGINICIRFIFDFKCIVPLYLLVMIQVYEED